MSTDGIVLKTQQIQLKKGLSGNETELRVDKGSEAAYIKSMEKSDWVKNEAPLSRADDGFYYLIPGKYDIKISYDKLSSKAEFTIK